MDKILKSKGNARGNTSVMALQDLYLYFFIYIFIIYLYYSFVCSQNEKAVQTFKRLVPNALPGTLPGVLICTESPPCGWTWPCLVQDWLLCHSALSFLCPALHSLSLTLYFPFTKCPDIIWACLRELSCAWAMQLSTSCLCLSSGTMILLHSVHSGKIWVAPHCAWEWPDPGTCTHPAGWRKARLANSSFVSM